MQQLGKGQSSGQAAVVYMHNSAATGFFYKIKKDIFKNKYLLLLLLPGVIWYIIFMYFPMYGIIIAFKDFKLQFGHTFFQTISESKWVGLNNYINFFQSPYAFRIVRNTVLIGVYDFLWGFPMPIVFAILLNEVYNQKYKRFVQTVTFLPHFISVVAIVGMFSMFLSPSTGVINLILSHVFQIKPIYFMMEPGWFRTIYIGTDLWQKVGWNAIVYIAAISNLNQDMYEAATVDGATRIQKILHITIPALKGTIAILMILRVGNILNVGWEKIIAMYQPTTYETADVIQTYVYRIGLMNAQYSLSAAIGLFNSVINVILLLSSNWFSKKFLEENLF